MMSQPFFCSARPFLTSLTATAAVVAAVAAAAVAAVAASGAVAVEVVATWPGAG